MITQNDANMREVETTNEEEELMNGDSIDMNDDDDEHLPPIIE